MDEDEIRSLLCDMGSTIRDEVIAARSAHSMEELSAQVGEVAADVTYGIDRIGEARVLSWFADTWPTDQPVRLVMEGIEDDRLVVFPADAETSDVRWLGIIDPIDGTRNLMYDKRSGWVLAAVAPATIGPSGWPEAWLSDVVASAMTEIPTTKQWRADQFSGVAGCGPDGVVAEAHNVMDGTTSPLPFRPSGATWLAHGFSSFSHYLPDGKAWLADVEQRLWDRLWPSAGESRPIFEDQYICSAGQLAEVMAGRDRIVGDLRPLAARHIAEANSLTCCHPYDICTSMLLIEIGGVFESPVGGPVDCPLDTTTPVAWMAYANPALADLVRPALAEVLAETT